MKGEPFTVDTNILIYSVDRQAGSKHLVAREIVELMVGLDCWLTLQAISEFYAAATRKGRVSPADAAAQANDWLQLFPTLSASASAVRLALAAAVAKRASYWDALLVATAAEGGCTAIITEDLADGRMLEGVRIINPFGNPSLSAAVRALLFGET